MAGIYIHIPFCKQKCSYCDFHFSTTFDSYRGRMISAIIQELKDRKDYLEDKVVETIYFGGGTPSLLIVEEISGILDAIRNHYSVSETPEITLEANPDDISMDHLAMWKQNGISRLSIGLQSFKSSDLDWMNRAHTVDEALNCVMMAQNAGFNNLTVDLIYGLPGLTPEEWKSHIQRVIDFNVPHVSAYCLTVENKTALSKWVQTGKIIPSDEEAQSEQFNVLAQMLKEQEFTQYEISNFSKPGYESRHNSSYWKGEWYLGVGPSAHSFNGVSRRWNIANNTVYMKGVEVGANYHETEMLSGVDRFNEYVLTGLRTIYGIDRNHLNSISEPNSEFETKLLEFIGYGWVENQGSKIILTEQGKLKADHIASELFITQEHL